LKGTEVEGLIWSLDENGGVKKEQAEHFQGKHSTEKQKEGEKMKT